MFPPASPSARSLASESPKSDRGGGGFTIPRTPTLCVRRASFKALSNSLGKKIRSKRDPSSDDNKNN